MTGLAVDQLDTLAGYAGLGSAIDYMISRDDRDEANFTIFCMAADGSPKTNTTLTVDVPEATGPTAGEQRIIELLERIEAVAMKVA